MKNVILIALAFLSTSLASCGNDPAEYSSNQKGQYNRKFVQQLKGFSSNREQILKEQNVFLRDFVVWSTDSAWSLVPSSQVSLKNIREAVERPSERTLLQKVIPLADISTYMDNVYGGTIGGFISRAADTKNLATMYDVYWGLRLDYGGTKFRPNGAGYGVLRFYSPSASMLTIPYCPEMGGTQPHDWPNGGGGFTTSKLGDGGYPEYVAPNYDTPREGAELYEVTPEGREILRSIFTSGAWKTYEDSSLPAPTTKSTNKNIRNGRVTDTKGTERFVQTYGTYKGKRFTVRALIKGEYHLVTMTPYEGLALEVVEKGVYGITVPESEVSDVQEIEL